MAKISILKRLARLGALDADVAEKIVKEQDGGPGSGNFGHAGRPGKVGGSAGKGGGGSGSSGGGGESQSGTTPLRGVERARSAIRSVLKGMSSSGKHAKELKRDLEWVSEAPNNKEFLRRSRDVKDVWDKVIKSGTTDFPYNEYGAFLKAAEMSERMANSGNYGHSGRPEKVGGSAESISGGIVGGNLGQNSFGEKFVGKDYSLKAKGLQSITRRKGKDGKMVWSGSGKDWKAVGEKSQQFPNGSGTTRINERDVAIGLHTINKYLRPDGTLTPERAKMHEDIIRNKFKNAKPVPEGQQPVCYMLGGGSASGKSAFTREGERQRYNMPGDAECPVLDADAFKNDIPEYQYDPKTKTGTGTTNRKLAASFAHEESSAIVKRAMEAAINNRYNFTLDGTGDGTAEKMIKKIRDARAKGYRVEGKYCTKEIDSAIYDSLARGIKKGRDVQIDALVDIHKAVSEIVPKIASEFDHFELYDNNERGEPVLIATCERGGEIKEINPQMYRRFLNKVAYNRDKAKENAIAEKVKKDLGVS